MIPSPNEQLCLQRAFGPRSPANITPTRPDQASPASAPALRMALPHIARATRLPLTNGSRFFSERSGSAELNQIVFPVRLPRQGGCRRTCFDGSHVSPHRKTVRRTLNGIEAPNRSLR